VASAHRYQFSSSLFFRIQATIAFCKGSLSSFSTIDDKFIISKISLFPKLNKILSYTLVLKLFKSLSIKISKSKLTSSIEYVSGYKNHSKLIEFAKNGYLLINSGSTLEVFAIKSHVFISHL
jgi:hypothetical protein